MHLFPVTSVSAQHVGREYTRVGKKQIYSSGIWWCHEWKEGAEPSPWSKPPYQKWPLSPTADSQDSCSCLQRQAEHLWSCAGNSLGIWLLLFIKGAEKSSKKKPCSKGEERSGCCSGSGIAWGAGGAKAHVEKLLWSEEEDHHLLPCGKRYLPSS